MRHQRPLLAGGLLLLAQLAGCGDPPEQAETPPAPAPAVAPAPAPPGVEAAAREIIATARYATLGTLGPDGHPQARVVDPFEPDSAFVVIVATNARSRKVAEIAADPRVTLLYLDAAGGSYVTVVGRAELVRDEASRLAFWKEEWAAFYQDRNLGEDYQLIRIRPTRLEVSSERHGIRNDSLTWRPVLVPFP